MLHRDEILDTQLQESNKRNEEQEEQEYIKAYLSNTIDAAKAIDDHFTELNQPWSNIRVWAKIEDINAIYDEMMIELRSLRKNLGNYYE